MTGEPTVPKDLNETLPIVAIVLDSVGGSVRLMRRWRHTRTAGEPETPRHSRKIESSECESRRTGINANPPTFVLPTSFCYCSTVITSTPAPCYYRVRFCINLMRFLLLIPCKSFFLRVSEYCCYYCYYYCCQLVNRSCCCCYSCCFCCVALLHRGRSVDWIIGIGRLVVGSVASALYGFFAVTVFVVSAECVWQLLLISHKRPSALDYVTIGDSVHFCPIWPRRNSCTIKKHWIVPFLP